MSDLIIVGDQAFSPEEWERHQRSTRRTRDAAYWREYRRKRGDEMRAYQREYQARRRVYEMSDEELETKIEFHQRLVSKYLRERAHRTRRAA